MSLVERGWSHGTEFACAFGHDRRGVPGPCGRARVHLGESGRRRRSPTLAELVEASGLNKSTTYYLVRTLSSLEVLRYDEQTRRYSLGRTLVRLGSAASSSHDEIAAIKRAVANLPEAFNVTIVLYRRFDVDRVVIVDKSSEGRV